MGRAPMDIRILISCKVMSFLGLLRNMRLRKVKSDGERRKVVMSRDQQSLGVFLGDGEELEGGLAGTPRALLPAANGAGADIQIGGEKGLEGLLHFLKNVDSDSLGHGQAPDAFLISVTDRRISER